MTTAKRDTLLIDLDGTLVDSAPDIARAANAQLARIGRAPLETAAIKGMVGDGFAKLLERALEASGGQPSPEEVKALNEAGLADYFDHVTDETIPYPGAAVTLAGLKAEGWTLAVCTNKPLVPTKRILENLALDSLFAGVAGGDSYPFKKPDPRHLLSLLEELGSAPERAVMLGDHRNDLQSGHAAGLPVVLVTFGYSSEPVESLGAEALIDSFEALPAALAALA